MSETSGCGDDCLQAIEELQRFIDDELPEVLHEMVATHLGRCGDCHQAFEFHVELRQVIRTKALADEIPPSLREKLRSCFGDDTDNDAKGDTLGDTANQ